MGALLRIAALNYYTKLLHSMQPELKQSTEQAGREPAAPRQDADSHTRTSGRGEAGWRGPCDDAFATVAGQLERWNGGNLEKLSWFTSSAALVSFHKISSYAQLGAVGQPQLRRTKPGIVSHILKHRPEF